MPKPELAPQPWGDAGELPVARVTCRLLLVDEGQAGEPATPPSTPGPGRRPTRILLVSSASGRAWVTPGGTWEPRTGEGLSEAAQREGLEEAGVTAAVERLMYLWLFLPPSDTPSAQDMPAAEAAGRLGRPASAPAAVGPVLEVFFLARAASADRNEFVSPSGVAWQHQDPDGPRREARWFTPDQLSALATPIYPQWLRDRFWTDLAGGREQGRWPDPYLGFSPRSG